MPVAAQSTASAATPGKPKLYNPRHPQRSLLYQTVADHFETWYELASAGQFNGQGDHHTPKPYVHQAFRKYLECGIFAHGFARAWCDDCGHDYFVAFSCKGRGVCPSCNTRRMVETAAHLTDHVFPRLPVRQWVLSVPKRLRYFMQRDALVLNMVLRIFLRVIAQSLQAHSPGAASVDKTALHLGAVAFIHRFGSSLNEHVHFHVCVVDGVFEAVAGSVIFHPTTGIDDTAVAQAQATLRRRILRAFVGRGLLESVDAKEMLAYPHRAPIGIATTACWHRIRRCAARSRPWLHRCNSLRLKLRAQPWALARLGWCPRTRQPHPRQSPCSLSAHQRTTCGLC
jgi:Transposase zinc-binding domain/Putative transposase